MFHFQVLPINPADLAHHRSSSANPDINPVPPNLPARNKMKGKTMPAATSAPSPPTAPSISDAVPPVHLSNSPVLSTFAPKPFQSKVQNQPLPPVPTMSPSSSVSSIPPQEKR